MNDTTTNQNPTDENFAAPPRTFSEAIRICFVKFWDDNGRASRSEFWWFCFFETTLIVIILGGPFIIFSESTWWDVAWYLLMAGTLGPAGSVTMRRLHDTGRHWAWMLLPITVIGIPVWIYMLAQPGQSEKNRYDGVIGTGWRLINWRLVMVGRMKPMTDNAEYLERIEPKFIIGSLNKLLK